MIDGPDPAAAIGKIDQELKTGFRYLKFTTELEHQYEKDNTQERTRHVLITGLIGLILYDIFLISDWQMVRDVFNLAVVLRIFIYSPIVFLALFLVSRRPPMVVREGTIAIIGILCSSLILLLFSSSTSPLRYTYHYGTLIIMMFVTMVQRARFGYAVASICGIIILQWITISRSGIFTAEMVQSEMSFYAASAILILFAGYAQAREERRNYLLVKRGRLLNRQLDRVTKIDPLTGLWNRRYLDLKFEAAWNDTAMRGKGMTVILLDIDHFKTFNDSYGHIEGDRCLQRLGTCVQTALGGIASIAVRFGGEEFLVFLWGVGAIEGYEAAQTLRQAIHGEAIPFPALGVQAVVTASIGVATASPCDMTSVELVAAADAALYDAKRTGRDRIVRHMTGLGPDAPIAAIANLYA